VNGTGATSFNSGTFTAKKYIMFQAWIDRSGTATNTEFRMGNTTIDTGSNYARRRSADGGADDTTINQDGINLRTASNEEFFVGYIINNSANEKLVIIHQVNQGTAGAGNAPNRSEYVAKWVNTSNQADILGWYSGGSNTLGTNSVFKVWGSD
jgi:hypothetical protein